MPWFELEGLDELNNNIEKLLKSVSKEEAAPILGKSADFLRDDIISRAPLGSTGNLKRGIVSKTYSDYKEAAALVMINYGRAPHAHLVEFGHAGKNPAPPHPFFRPAWDDDKQKIEEDIKQELLEIIERAVP